MGSPPRLSPHNLTAQASPETEQKELWRNRTGNFEKGLRAKSLNRTPSASSLTRSQEEMFPYTSPLPPLTPSRLVPK